MYKVFNMGHRLEFYVTESIASEIIDISKSYNVDARVIGIVEESEKPKVTIDSDYGLFIYP